VAVTHDPDDIDDLALALTPSEAMRLTPRASVGAALACAEIVDLANAYGPGPWTDEERAAIGLRPDVANAPVRKRVGIHPDAIIIDDPHPAPSVGFMLGEHVHADDRVYIHNADGSLQAEMPRKVYDHLLTRPKSPTSSIMEFWAQYALKREDAP
jgi:hypothetical protein